MIAAQTPAPGFDMPGRASLKPGEWFEVVGVPSCGDRCCTADMVRPFVGHRYLTRAVTNGGWVYGVDAPLAFRASEVRRVGRHPFAEGC